MLQMELLQDFYETTLEALKDAKNDRLWFKTNTKLGKLYFDRSDFNKLAKILKQLHQSCQVSNWFLITGEHLHLFWYYKMLRHILVGWPKISEAGMGGRLE